MSSTIAVTVALMSGVATGLGDSAVQATVTSKNTINAKVKTSQRSMGDPLISPSMAAIADVAVPQVST